MTPYVVVGLTLLIWGTYFAGFATWKNRWRKRARRLLNDIADDLLARGAEPFEVQLWITHSEHCIRDLVPLPPRPQVPST